MALKKFSLRTILPSCVKANKNPSSDQKPQVSKQIYLQRLSLSDVSNPSSLISLSDMSNSVFGSNLHIFTLKELELITQNFSKYNYLDEGGFGEVYKGFIDEKLRPGLKAQPVAVKSLNLDGTQGHREWLAEVIFLGQLKHPHLVNLIGYCCADEHRLLVYEYMERGNLENQLFKRYSGTLPWLSRIKIAVGAAKGLAFLHEEVKPVIYRDFKTSNILLDLDYTPKLSDFGFATDGPEGEELHITTCIMGTEGYAAPEYMNNGYLTTMSDVFSFGVVLLELLTGRRSVDRLRPCRERDLVEWARPLLKDPHKLDRIMDPRLDGQYSTKGAKKAAALAYHCLSNNYKSRPAMSIVAKTLESLLDLTDIPIGPFVYIVPNEGKDCENRCNEVKVGNKSEEKEEKKGKNCENRCDEVKGGNKSEEKEEKKGKHLRRQKRRRHRHQIKSLRSRAVYSDTVLYKNLGTRLYSPLK